MPRPYVFSDRDGTLLHDPGFLHRIEDYAPLPGATEGLRMLQDAGFGLVIVTNQSGIGRGYFSEEAYQRFESHVVRSFAAEGVKIDATYYCPHTPDDACPCRKPATGLIEHALEELDIKLEESWVVGDKPEDVELAQRAGCAAIYVLTGQGKQRRAEVGAGVPIASDFREAAAYILAERARHSV